MEPLFYTVISCFSAFLLGVGFGLVFVFERNAKRAFEDSING